MSFSAMYPNALNDQDSIFGRGAAILRTEIKAANHPDTNNHIPEQITPTSFQAFKFMMFFLNRAIKRQLLRLWLGTV
jgi:hypothetical protein